MLPGKFYVLTVGYCRDWKKNVSSVVLVTNPFALSVAKRNRTGANGNSVNEFYVRTHSTSHNNAMLRANGEPIVFYFTRSFLCRLLKKIRLQRFLK